MCNLYSITTNQAAINALFRVVNRYVGNLAPMPGDFPDYKAPIVRNGVEGRELATARWGMPSSSKALMDATKKRAEKLQAKGKAGRLGVASGVAQEAAVDEGPSFEVLEAALGTVKAIGCNTSELEAKISSKSGAGQGGSKAHAQGSAG